MEKQNISGVGFRSLINNGKSADRHLLYSANSRHKRVYINSASCVGHNKRSGSKAASVSMGIKFSRISQLSTMRYILSDGSERRHHP